MRAKLRPWAEAMLWGYALCAACFTCFPFSLALVPAIVRKLALCPTPEGAGLREGLRIAVITLPLLLVHLCASTLGLVLSRAFAWPPTALLPFTVAVLTGPLALPWVGALAYAGEPLRAAAACAFDRWDERGLVDWLTQGLVLGAILGVPFFLFSLGDGVLFFDEPLTMLAGLGLVPAGIGLGARHAVIQTRRVATCAARPILATSVVVALGTVVPLAFGLLGWSRTRWFITPTLPDYLLVFGTLWLLPAIGLGIAWYRRRPNREVRCVGATIRGTVRVTLGQVVAGEDAALLFDDGAVWTLEPGAMLDARIELGEQLEAGSRVEICLTDVLGEGAFRETHARDAFVELRPHGARTRSVRVPQGGWLALAHGAMLVVSMSLWSMADPSAVTDDEDVFDSPQVAAPSTPTR